ncbi:MAG: hypothetical protein E7627_03405 [Ruminococcaceae bacterium]|nr:hypothetical protein [Oscillospiraceae bacterium]
MKRAIPIIAIFVLLLLSLTLLSSCVNEDSQNKINNETTEPVVTLNEEKPATGFPSGQLQKEYIFYGGVVWTYDMYNTAEQKLKELPKDFTFIGQTLLEDPYVMPSEDFHTAHIEPGKDVYISTAGDAIYIELKKGIYYRYIPEKSIYPTPPETTLPSETTEPEPDDNTVYTAEYYSGSYNGYDFVDYEDEDRGEVYQKAYPNKYFNDNVTIELEITAKLEQTTYSAGDKFWIDFKATNAGEPFMYIDWEVNYFDSWLVNTEHVTEAGTNFEFHNDYYADGRPSLDAGPYEDLFEKGETRVDRNPYTVTADIPTGKYDLYIYFGGFTFVVRDALEIINEDSSPTLPPETTPPEPDDNTVYTAEYYSGSYNGYDFVDYEDEEWGEYFKEMYPNKHFNDNVAIELEITYELEKTTFKHGEKFWISFTATNIGEPFMFIDHWAGYFNSRLVSTEHTATDGSDYIFHNDYYTDGRDMPDAEAFEDLFETGETRVDANPYTVTADTPSGSYDLYIYFNGFTFIVRDALEIFNDNFKPASEYVTEALYQSEKNYGYTPSGTMWNLDYSLRLPRVEISPEIDEIVNGEINELFYDPAIVKIANKNASFDIDYSAYKNGDIVSLIISKHEGYDISGFTYYCVNVSVSENRKLTLADIVQTLDLNYDSVISNLENPREDLFYLNTDGELIVLDYRLEAPELDRYMYYAYNVSNNTGRFIN